MRFGCEEDGGQLIIPQLSFILTLSASLVFNMPTVFTHAYVAAAMGAIYPAHTRSARFWLLSMLSAVLPDADVAAFLFGVPYEHMFGHRGFTHSFVFALLLALAVVAIFFRDTPDRKTLVAYFFLVTASHPLLDALTDGGLGVALFAPFSDARYFFPARPVEVSPIGLSSFLSEWGLRVIGSELVWIWIPATLAAVVVLSLRLRGRLRERGD